VDEATDGALRRAVDAVAFQAERNQQLDLPGLAPFDRVIVIGTGTDEVTSRLLEDVGGLVGQAAAQSPAERIEILWDGNEPSAAAHLAFGAVLGQYRFTKYREVDPDMPAVGEGRLVIRTPQGASASAEYQEQWAPVNRAVVFVRDLITEPAVEIYPESFVQRTREAFAGLANVRIEVLDVPAMEELGMGGILAVGRGSARPPRLMVVRYEGGKRNGKGNAAPLAFVGKGITFDSGGITLKDGDGMWKMKYDMSGAAAATGAVLALAGRQAPVNAVALAALAENMPSGTAGRPGDVVRTMSGKTFEVISTDAEGRMVLSDAVWYAQQEFEPRLVIDLATLTGSVRTALGDEYAGLFSRDDALAAQLEAAGRESGEDLWRLPLHPSYAKDMESPIADLKNSGGEAGAGAGLGAHFIGAFIEEDMPWAHLDIAGMAWREQEGLPTSPTGAVGFGVRLLDRFVRSYYE
ncbi:MAG TPA: leucyl aminopeptidase, partial [Woeseiaceae bacterium]|nr:leucyl aminopeptidase [Woeseiaceae bacterium]